MEKILNLLRESGALLEGHFLLSSGKHSDKYFQCAKLFQYPEMARVALEDTAKKIHEDIISGKIKVDIIAGPAIGGIIAAWELARQLSLPAIFTERDENGKMTLRRGFELQSIQDNLSNILPGTPPNILIVEDVVTTGKSSLECSAALIEAGGVISGLACLVDRRTVELTTDVNKDFPQNFYPAIKLKAETWDVNECILCKQGIPLVKPGSRKI
jgi:orotate phosphoribosyltransferase